MGEIVEDSAGAVGCGGECLSSNAHVSTVQERKCGACGESRCKEEFSNKQWAANSKRRCKACVDGGKEVPVAAQLCDNPGCDKPGVNSCAKCRRVWYCSKECQKAHWKVGHKALCVSKVVAAAGSGLVDEGRQRWRLERLTPFVESGASKEALGSFAFDRRVEEGAIPCGDTLSRRALSGANLQRQLVLFVDLGTFQAAAPSDCLWLSDVAGCHFASKEHKRPTKAGAHLDSARVAHAANAYIGVKNAYASQSMQKVGPVFLGYAVVVTDSHADYDITKPDVVCFEWPESCIVKWQRQLETGKVE